MLENAVWGVLLAVPICWLLRLAIHAHDGAHARKIARARFLRTGKTRAQIMAEARGNIFPAH